MFNQRTFQLLFAEGILVLVKIEKTVRNRRASWFVFGIVVQFEVGVLESFFDRDAL